MKIDIKKLVKKTRRQLAAAFGGHSQYSLAELGSALIGQINQKPITPVRDKFPLWEKAWEEGLKQEQEFWEFDDVNVFVIEEEKEALFRRAKEYLTE